MSILDRDSLEQSPLSDLHTIASELSIDGYRRLRKADLIDAILTRQGGGGEAAASEQPEGADQPEEVSDGEESSPRRRRWRRGGRAPEEGDEGEAAQDELIEGE